MKPAYYIIGALALWIIFRECSRGPEPIPASVQADMDSITSMKRQAWDLVKRGRVFLDEVAKDTTRHKEVLKANKMRIQDLEQKLAAAIKKRPEVIRDTIYILQDSIIQDQAMQIARAHQEYDKLNTDYTSLLKVKDAELRIKDEMFSHMESINSELFRSLNKERRRGKVWKVAVPVALVIGFIVGEEL